MKLNRKFLFRQSNLASEFVKIYILAGKASISRDIVSRQGSKI